MELCGLELSQYLNNNFKKLYTANAILKTIIIVTNIITTISITGINLLLYQNLFNICDSKSSYLHDK